MTITDFIVLESTFSPGVEHGSSGKYTAAKWIPWFSSARIDRRQNRMVLVGVWPQ